MVMGKLRKPANLPHTQLSISIRSRRPLFFVFVFVRFDLIGFMLLQAKRAVEAGVCIDLFVLTNAFVGLSSLKFLTSFTGGNLVLYEQPEGASLPQDLYITLSTNMATSTTLEANSAGCAPRNVQVPAVHTPAGGKWTVSTTHITWVQGGYRLWAFVRRPQIRQSLPHSRM